MSTTLALSSSSLMSSLFHQLCMIFSICSRLYSSSSFTNSVGIPSGPGAFLLLNCLAILISSSIIISPMSYFSTTWYLVILLFLNLCLLDSFKSFCSWLGSPHCSLLKYSATSCVITGFRR